MRNVAPGKKRAVPYSGYYRREVVKLVNNLLVGIIAGIRRAATGVRRTTSSPREIL